MTYDYAKYMRDWRARNPGRAKEHRQRWKENNPAGYLLYKSKARAKQAGLEYLLTKEWIDEHLVSGRCEVTGIPFTFELGTWYRK